MADGNTRTIRSTRDGTVVTGIPSDATNEQIAEAFARVRSNAGAGNTGSYAPQQQQPAPQQSRQAAPQQSQPKPTQTVTDPRTEITFTNIPPSATDDELRSAFASLGATEDSKGQSYDYQQVVADNTSDARAFRGADQQAQAAAAARPEVETTTGGLAGGVLRGAAPYAAAAGTGAAIGSVVPGFGTAAGAATGLTSAALTQIAAPAVTTLMNNILGTSYDDPREAARAFFTQLGVPEPDSRAEMLIQEVTNSGAQALGMVTGGGLLAAGAPALGAPTTAQGAGQMLSTQPGQQIQGALRAPIGGELAGRAAEGMGAGPTGQGVARMVGSLGADMTSSVGPLPSQGAVRRAVKAQGSENATIASGRRAIAEGNERGVQVLRSDIFPPDSPLGRSLQAMRETLGAGGLRAEQQRGRNRAVQELLTEFELTPGLADDLSPSLARSFVEPRKAAFTRYGNMKQEAMDSVPKDEIINVDNTLAYIDDQIERLTRRGGANADVNVAQDTGSMTAEDARQGGVNQDLISKLQQWRAAFQNNNREDLELNRRDFGNAFIPERGYGEMSPRDREVVEGVYDNVRADIGEAVRRSGGEEAYENWATANENLSNLQRDLHKEVISDLVAPLRGQDNVEVPEGLPLEAMEEAQRNTVMKIQQSPELIRDIAISGRPSDIRTVVPYLDRKGRRTMVAAMIQDDLREATPNIYDTSPSEFANNLQKSVNRRGVVMTPEEEQSLEGLKIFLDRTRRAEPVSARPSQSPSQSVPDVPGMRYNIAKAIGRGVGTAVGVVGGGMLAGRNLASLYESPEMRDMLLELVEAGADSPRAGAITSAIMRRLADPEDQEEVGENARHTAETIRGRVFRGDR